MLSAVLDVPDFSVDVMFINMVSKDFSKRLDVHD